MGSTGGIAIRNYIIYSVHLVVRVVKSRGISWAGLEARMEEGRSAFKIVTYKPTGKRPLGSPRRRLEDNIRKDLKEIGANTRNFINSSQDVDYWRSL